MSEIELSDSESDSKADSQQSKSSRKRKAYSVEKKLEAVEYAKKCSKISASKKFNVSRRSVIDWCQQEGKLREQRKGSKRLQGAGRHLTFSQIAREDKELSQLLKEIYLEQGEENIEYAEYDSDASLI